MDVIERVIYFVIVAVYTFFVLFAGWSYYSFHMFIYKYGTYYLDPMMPFQTLAFVVLLIISIVLWIRFFMSFKSS